MQDTKYKTSERDTAQTKIFNLEKRTFIFAKDVREFVHQLSRSLVNEADMRQLIRSSGAVGANYIEANDALGSKDFLMRLKIARKEAKESKYWLELLEPSCNKSTVIIDQGLISEAEELVKILSAMISKRQTK